MNVDFSPKKQFQTNDALRKELQIVVTSDNFHQALAFAVSEYSIRFLPTTEQATAIRNFIWTLTNLSSEIPPAPVFPDKSLDPKAWEPRQPPPFK